MKREQEKWSNWHMDQSEPPAEPEAKPESSVNVLASAFVIALSAFVLSGGFHNLSV